MDIVIALSLEWIDPRLKWNFDQFDIPIRDIRVNSKDIWTPNIDLANRIYNFSPTSEIHLKASLSHKGNVNYALVNDLAAGYIMIFYSGEVRQYRLIRAHVNFGTDSKFYPYDTQMPILKLRSLDYGKNEITLTTRNLNNLNQVNPTKIKVNDITELSLIQDGFCIPINCILIPSRIVGNYIFQNFSKHENYESNSEWRWTSYSYSGRVSN